MTGYSSVGLSGLSFIDNLIQGSKWGGALGSGVTVTFSFSDNFTLWSWPSYGLDNEPWVSPSLSLTISEQLLAQNALQAWGNVANISFSLVTDDNLSRYNGDIRFSVTDLSPGILGQAYFPNGEVFGAENGDVWLDIDYLISAPTANRLHDTILHEIGHAIGLAHPHDTGGISTIASAANDWIGVSVMSYKTFEGAPSGSTSSRYPTTPMLSDIAAIQYVYGPNLNYNSGNTTYSWAVGAGILETIWDGGGIDTIDWSNQSTAALINLNEGAWSQIGPAYNLYTSGGLVFDHSESRTLAIAYGAVIENAFGGSGDDILIGNQANNYLRGNLGGDGLEGGPGADSLDGGTGFDGASYLLSSTGVSASLTTPGANTGDAAGDTYTSIEWLLGSDFNDTLEGDGADNALYGRAGSDFLIGGAGADTLEGGAGADNLDGGSGIDGASYELSLTGVNASLATPGTNTGDAAGDSYASIENLLGSNFGDVLRGDTNANLLQGLSGNDTLLGGAGADTLDGGTGTDTASYASSVSAITVDLSNTANNTGDAAGDSYVSIERILGSNFADALTGNSAGNDLRGGAGADILIGGAGADSLNGGTSFDYASYLSSAAGVSASLTTPGANTGDAAGDNYSSIEGIKGSNFNDTLEGDGAANQLFGSSGNDWLEGRTGADSLDGGAGFDYASYALGAAGVNASLTTPGANTGDAAGDTYTSIEGLRGTDFNDTLTGNSAANILLGRQGNDTLLGLSGNDALWGGNGNDTLEGGTGVDTLNGGTGFDGASYLLSAAGVTASLATPGANTGDAAGDSYASIEGIIGSNFNDTLEGDGAGNDLQGGIGDDLLVGGGGADSLDGGTGFDGVSYLSSAAGVSASLTTPGANTGDALGDTYTSIEGFIGSNFNDTLEGDGAANVLIGNLGDDSLLGFNGNDSMRGEAGNDTLTGGSNDDELNGGAGADSLDGGTGTDTASYANAASAVTADLSNVAGNTGEAVGDIYTSIENLAGSVFGDVLRGDANTNLIQGSSGNDTLLGDAGADTLDGGIGIDTASYASAASGVTVDLSNTANNTGDAAGDSYVSIERILGSDFADTLTGDGAGNDLQGGAGADTLMGGAGADSLTGDADFDYASYASSSVGIFATQNFGFLNNGEAAGDTFSGVEGMIGSVFNDILGGNNTDNDILGGDGNDWLFGFLGADTLQGGIGDDTLNGGAGADSLDGGTDFDFASYKVLGTVGVNASLTTPGANTGDAAGDIYTSIEGLKGTDFNDMLEGDGAANYLIGHQGNDTLIGGGLADTLNGGGGIDTASYASAASGVTVDLSNTANNTGDAAGDSYISIEQILGSGFADTLTGDGAGNDLQGGAGADTIAGGVGGDTLNGGTGTDTASYATSGAGIFATQNFGFLNNGDAAGDSFVSVENMLGSSFDDILGGNDSANNINGGAGSGADWLFGFLGDDTLLGGAGADTLNGGAGADSLYGGADFDFASYKVLGSAPVNASLTTPGANTGDAAGDTYTSIEGLKGTDFNDTLEGDGGANTLIGHQGDDSLLGLSGADSLVGGGGADTLNGGLGSDTLEGNNGDDTFVYGLGDGADTINGFVVGAASDDVLSLSLGAAFDTFLEVQAAAAQVGPDTVIDFGGGDTITLLGVTAANLHADDFIFV